MTLETYIQQLGSAAKNASLAVSASTTEQRNNALLAIADCLLQRKAEVMNANAQDVAQAQARNLSSALLDRLTISESVFDGMIEGIKQVAALNDVIGTISNITNRPSGIQVGKMRVPLGVVAIIYESRPNVTIEASSLCIKSGNAAILRGGSEAIRSNQLLADVVHQGLKVAGLDQGTVAVLDTTDRDAVDYMIQMNQYIDVVIPRGGKGLIERISNNATVSVIKHLDGVCHVYIDEHANDTDAVAITINAKTHRYGVCNAIETLLVHEQKAAQLLPQIAAQLKQKQVAIRGCEKTQLLLADYPQLTGATEEDWSSEYLAPILATKVISSLTEAIVHINHYGSHHTDAIVTENYTHAWRFLQQVDSSSVIVNASTRFADGFEYGLGAEVGISTDKIHARGPVGLEGLTSEKYIVFGNGTIRQ